MSPWLLPLLSAALLILPRALRPPTSLPGELRGPVGPLWCLNLLYCHFLHRLRVEGPPTIPERGPAILIANHTCGIDHMVLQAASRRLLGFIIAQEFYDVRVCRPFCRLAGCIPVRRDGRDLSATRAALRALENGRVVPIFPEGKILPTSGRELGEGKPGVAFLALRARVPVVPAYIRGTPAIKNVWRAMVTPSEARVVFGPPIDLSDWPPEASGDREALAAVTERLMDAIRALRASSLGGEPGGETAGAAATPPPSEASREPEPRRPQHGPVEIPGGLPAHLGA